MKYAIILVALLAFGSATAQSAPHGDSGAIEYAKQWYAQNGMGNYPHGNSSGLSCASSIGLCSYAGTCSADSCPEPTIPQSWSSDQGDPEIRCYHYDDGPDRDRLIARCMKIVRQHR